MKAKPLGEGGAMKSEELRKRWHDAANALAAEERRLFGDDPEALVRGRRDPHVALAEMASDADAERLLDLRLVRDNAAWDMLFYDGAVKRSTGG